MNTSLFSTSPVSLPNMSSPRAPRGRPPQSDGAETRTRLLDAASAACAHQGFDGATVTEIARRAGVTPAAIYNHFKSREALLYQAGVRGLRRMTAATSATAAGAGKPSFRDVAAAYCHPDMGETRRLLAELHLASRRHEKLASLLASWHKSQAVALAGKPDGDVDVGELATAKTFFLLLLGICHLDDLEQIEAEPAAVADRIGDLADHLESFSR